MHERRKDTRYPVSVRLSISDFFKQGHGGIHDLDTPITLEDVSHSGLCFISECILPVGYFFNARVILEDRNIPPIFTTIKIIHVEIINRTNYRYGCSFTNPTEGLDEMIDRYLLS